jgi:hypothetical protein
LLKKNILHTIYNMKLLKKLEKMFSGRVLLLIGVVVVVLALGGYSMEKGKIGESMKPAMNPTKKMGSAEAQAHSNAPSVEVGAGGPGAANPKGENSGPAAVSDVAKPLHRTPPPFYQRTKTASGLSSTPVDKDLSKMLTF